MFESRQKAGGLLAQKLKDYKDQKNAVVIAIPRGGVVVAYEVARALNLFLDVVIIRKIGAPQNPELAIGAVGPARTIYWDHELIKRLGVSKKQRERLVNEKIKEQKRREELFRFRKKRLSFKGKTVIVVDDGIATGATAICAAMALRKKGAKEKILAVPVIAKDTLASVIESFEDICVLMVPEDFYAVGQFYEEFPQVSDNEVVELLRG